MKIMVRVLNPFAFILGYGERRFKEIHGKPCHQNGEYKVFRIDGSHYVTCRKNIIVSESTTPPVVLIQRLVSGCKSENDVLNLYDRVLENYEKGLQFAKEVGFEVRDL